MRVMSILCIHRLTHSCMCGGLFVRISENRQYTIHTKSIFCVAEDYTADIIITVLQPLFSLYDVHILEKREFGTIDFVYYNTTTNLNHIFNS